MSGKVIDLEKEFANFVEGIGGVVSDKTTIGPNAPTNADYVFHDEKIVAELKLLKTSPFQNKEFKKSFVKKQKEWLRKGYATPAQLEAATNITQLPEKAITIY